MGCGCGAVGIAVASDTRDPQFESSHPRYYSLLSTVLKTHMETMKIKKKSPKMAQLKNICGFWQLF